MKFLPDNERAALIVIPTVARPSVLMPAFIRLLEHLDGIPVHICVAINAVDEGDGDTSERELEDVWVSFADDGRLPAGSLLTVYRHPGPCGFGGALNRGILAAAMRDLLESDVWNPAWPTDMFGENGRGRTKSWSDDGLMFGARASGAGLPPLTIFYNDDLEAADGWLAELVEAAKPTSHIYDIIEPTGPDGSRVKRDRALYGTVGLIGPVTNNAAGMQCLADSVKDWKRLGTDRFAGKWRGVNAGVTLTADFLSGFCMGMTRDCMEALWGANPDRDGPYLFDEATYPIAGYEDNDICVRAAEAGFRAAICAGSFVGHIGHQSFDALFPEMKRGMRNRLNYYAKWAPFTRERARDLVAVLRVKIEVPHDLRLLRPTLGRLGQLVDKVAILFTNNPGEALRHEEGRAEAKAGEIPREDLRFMQEIGSPAVFNDREKLAKATLNWIRGCLTPGAQSVGREVPKVGFSYWPSQNAMNERVERNAVIEMAERMGASWIWSIDHDEVVEPRITRAHLDRWMSHPDPLAFSFDQGFYTTWDTTRLYRLDPPWGDGGTMRGGMRGFRLWRVNPKAPGRILAGTENGLHCGNSPTSDAMTKRHAAIRIYHHGYLRSEDRWRKKNRYDQQDPNPNPMLVGGTSYNHLVNEEQVSMSGFMQRCGIGLHMLVHAGEDPGGVMHMLDQLHAMVDAAVLVWTSPPDAPERKAFETIAHIFGASLIDYYIDPEQGGLGAARNAGIDFLAEADQVLNLGMGWSLFMDPDEHFPENGLISIRRMADATDCWGWIIRFLNPYDPKSKSRPTESESTRMARLRPEMRMAGRVHESFDAALFALKRAGYGNILRTAPFVCMNTGLIADGATLQKKYDRYMKWAAVSIVAGEGRAVDWTTIGLYFADQGLWEAPEKCFTQAVLMDKDSYLAARELALHYLRMAAGPARLSASRLPEGDPRREHMERILGCCDNEAPPINRVGTDAEPTIWTEKHALDFVDQIMLHQQAHDRARAEPTPD